jgi:thiamine pyrophosphate-dependent acetolactate synthase large subunit-like protein
MSNTKTGTLDRRHVMGPLLAARGDALVVTGLGSTTYDAGLADHPGTFYLWGAMGAAAMVGLGLALAQPTRRVVVFTGDGEMLMGIGSLATIGARAPANLAVVVIDNEHYSETGMQPTHTNRGVSLSGIAQACNFASAKTIYGDEELRAEIPSVFGGPGPVFLDVKVNTQRYPLSIRLRDGSHIKNRFREYLLGPSAFD